MSIKNCKECGKEVSTKAKACPHCGAEVKRKAGCLATFGAIVFVFVLIGVLSNVASRSPGNSEPAQAPSSSGATPAGKAAPVTAPKPKSPTPAAQRKPDLEVIDYKWATGEYGNRRIRGTVRNNTSRQYSYVQVEINLYDDSGSQVGSTMANVNNLEPKGTWKFEAAVFEDNATKARVKDISGF